MTRIKHPTEEFFHKIQKDLTKGLKKKAIVEKYSSFGVTIYVLRKFYEKSENLAYIKKKEAYRKRKDPIRDEENKLNIKSSEQKEKKELFLMSIIETLGNVSEACKLCGINRREFYEWLAKDEEFKSSHTDTIEREIDFAESKLKQEINDGNTTAIIFYLKTKGKKRGYIETQDTTGTIIIKTDSDDEKL